MKTTDEIDRIAYELARGYLPSLKINGVTESLVEKYLNPASLNPRPTTKQGLYQRVLESAQNANMKSGVIGRSIGGVDKLVLVLEDFAPGAVLTKYGNSWDLVLDEIVKRLKPRGQIRRTSRSIWPHYCQTILSAAAFVEQFATIDEFFGWVDFFDRDERARPGLPMLLSHEIEGFGFALSCDFLKELGYMNFPKPDVHLRDIFTALGLHDGDDDYQLFKAIIRVARNANVTPYNADKTFWLIGSGYFYNHVATIGTNGRIGNHKKEFIEYARSRIYK